MAAAVSAKQPAVSAGDKGSLLRRGSQGKKLVLKEKIVQIYEAFFRVCGMNLMCLFIRCLYNSTCCLHSPSNCVLFILVRLEIIIFMHYSVM